MQSPSIVWNMEELDRFSGNLVYVFFKHDNALYVGRTKNGLYRPFTINHHASVARKQATRLELFFTNSKKESSLLERDLINTLNPKFNKPLTLRQEKIKLLKEFEDNDLLQKRKIYEDFKNRNRVNGSKPKNKFINNVQNLLKRLELGI